MYVSETQFGVRGAARKLILRVSEGPSLSLVVGLKEKICKKQENKTKKSPAQIML